MPETDFTNATTTDVRNALVDFSVAPVTTDAAGDQKETEYQNATWTQDLGYYKTIPELRAAIDSKARWTVGNGYTADEPTIMLLDNLEGIGIDTFNTILENMIRTYHITGDSFAEIVRNDNEVIINLKPLDPSAIKIIANREGRIIRYEQVSKHKKPNRKIEPEKMLHFCRNRVADEIHGNSVIKAVENIILMRNEAMEDERILMHRNIVPLRVLEVDFDDTTKIALLKKQYEDAIKNREVIIIPKGTVSVVDSGTAPNSTLNPLAWIEVLNDYFYEAVQVPKVIIGNSKNFTDASSKIVYLAYEQNTKEDQLYIEEQILSQLNLVIELEFPASLQQDTVSDTPSMELEEEGQEPATQPNDTTEELEGKK